MSGIKVLVVDDIPEARELVRTMLGKNSSLLFVGEAATGQEAIDKAKKLSPDVVLMDYLLPGGMNGVEAAKNIKADLGAGN